MLNEGLANLEIQSSINNMQKKTVLKTFIALILSAVTAYFVMEQKLYVNHAVVTVGIIALMAFSFIAHLKIKSLPPVVCYLYLVATAVLTGLVVGLVLPYYDPQTVQFAFLSAAGFFGVLTAIGFTTKKDLSKLGMLCCVGVFVLIVVEIALWLFHFPVSTMLVSAISLVLFAGLTMYDSQRLKELPDGFDDFSENVSTFLAVSIYLDFYNIFLDILRIIKEVKE